MNESILQLRNITKTFPGVKALDRVTFDVRQGEIHGLIGENGAGKSTLMKVLMGIYHQDEGDILLKGSSVQITDPKDAIEKGIGMVPQELNLNPYVSAAENIFLGNEICRGKHIDWSATNEKAREVMASIGLTVNPKTIVSTLSSAQQQMVQLSRLLATGAEVLIFDEPTASLTSKETETLLELMRQLKKAGKTLIFITHHLDELLAVTDRITVMRDGQVVAVNETSDLTESLLIEQMAGKKMAKQTRVNREIADEEMLRVEHFTVGKRVKDVSFSVRKGEIFGIGGLVGAGRTELISAMFGIMERDSGKLYIEGEEVNIHSPNEAVRLGMGFLPEERRAHGIFPILSIQENMTLPLYPSLFRKGKLDYAAARKTASEYVQSISIKAPSNETPIKSLSGGNQQKVILARWLAKNARIIFMDEPTRGIDVNAKAEIYDLVRQITAEGVTVIVVSSEHEELMLLSDRIMVMHEGEMKGIVNGDSVKTSQDILEIALK